MPDGATVGPDHHGQRLDNFLLRILRPLPRPAVYRLIRTGQVRVNGGRARALQRLREGDSLRLPPNVLSETNNADSDRPRSGNDRPRSVPRFSPDDIPPVLWEDDRLLAVNKPAGLAVHGGSGIAFGVIERLRSARDEPFLELVHRLDKGTSGVLLLAKKSSALRELQRQWRAREVAKEYIAACFGEWRKSAARIRAPLRRVCAADGNRQVVVDDAGKSADTRTRLAGRWRGAVLVCADIRTGRTHQLRAHLAHPELANLPIVGDDKYGDFARNRSLPRGLRGRMFLHAAKLAFRHPKSGEGVEIEAPLPGEFGELAEFFNNGSDPRPAQTLLVPTLQRRDGGFRRSSGGLKCVAHKRANLIKRTLERPNHASRRWSGGTSV